MSYVQGTHVRLIADFLDEDGAPTDPLEAVLIVQPPSGDPFERRLSADELERDPDRTGRVSYVLDTSPAAGTWRYQFESTGNEAVVGRKEITVRARLSAA